MQILRDKVATALSKVILTPEASHGNVAYLTINNIYQLTDAAIEEIKKSYEDEPHWLFKDIIKEASEK